MIRRLVLSVLAAAALATAPAAASAGEVFVGAYTNRVDLHLIALCCYERGADLQLGYRTGLLRADARGGGLLAYGLGSVNTAGGVDFVAAGLAYRIPLGTGFYLQPGVGGAIQDRSALPYQATPDRLYLGSRVLFEPELTLGYRLDAHWAAEASYVHLSHAQLAGPQNPGLDDVGMRLAYRFGG